MPTYEYKCDACGHAFEKFHSMSAEPIKVCPVCGKEQVRRLIGTGAGLIFKGSGFYITDYRDSGYKDSAKADGDKSKADGGPGSKDGGKGADAPAGGGGEAKPAATASDAPAKPAAKSESGGSAKPAATPTPTPTPTTSPGDKK